MMKNMYIYYIMKLILLFGKLVACNIIVVFDSFDFEEFMRRVYIKWQENNLQQLQHTVTKIFFCSSYNILSLRFFFPFFFCKKKICRCQEKSTQTTQLAVIKI